MKKVLFWLSILSLSLPLCSCKVNLINTTADVPWYYVAIPIGLIMVISYFILINSTYICPVCKTEFKPKWYQLSVCIHIGTQRVAKCPKCGKKGLCDRKPHRNNTN